jgi:hypothetical protein
MDSIKLTCKCDTLFFLCHELAQSLQIVQAYLGGCNERLKNGELCHRQLADVLMIVNTQTELMNQQILSINFNETHA